MITGFHHIVQSPPMVPPPTTTATHADVTPTASVRAVPRTATHVTSTAYRPEWIPTPSTRVPNSPPALGFLTSACNTVRTLHNTHAISPAAQTNRPIRPLSGQQCYAGNSYGSYGKSDACTMPCDGNSTEGCGGEVSVSRDQNRSKTSTDTSPRHPMITYHSLSPYLPRSPQPFPVGERCVCDSRDRCGPFQL